MFIIEILFSMTIMVCIFHTTDNFHNKHLNQGVKNALYKERDCTAEFPFRLLSVVMDTFGVDPAPKW